MAAAYSRLRSFNVQYASSGPQRLPDWNPNAGGIKAFYFRDPDGHNLEVLAFPPGKGAPKWHNAGGRLFLGIDHTAIVVSNTERSLHFYRDTLGMRVAGSSENYGTEQEHLNNVFGAHLRITALRAEHGPGIEFLEYVDTGRRPSAPRRHPGIGRLVLADQFVRKPPRRIRSSSQGLESTTALKRNDAPPRGARLAQRPHYSGSGRAREPDRGGNDMYKNLVIVGGGFAGTKTAQRWNTPCRRTGR